MLKKLIVIPLIVIGLSIGSVLIAPPSIEAKACVGYTWTSLANYPGYVMSVSRPNYDENVKRIQVILNDISYATGDSTYRVDRDGFFGFQTQTAVLRYQDKHGLQRDGQVGPATWNSFKLHYRAPSRD